MELKGKINVETYIALGGILAVFFCFIIVRYIFLPYDGGGNSPVVITAVFWGTKEEKEIITGIVRIWEKSHPQIRVDLRHELPSNYTSRILTQVLGGVAPDIVFAETNAFVELYSKGILMDLTRFVRKDDAIKQEDFFSGIWNWFVVDGRIYGIPRDIAPIACVYYNKQLFDEAGLPYPTDDWDYNEFLENASRLTKRDNSGHIQQYGFYTWHWKNFIYTNGGRLVDDPKNPTQCLLDSPEAIEGLKKYTDLFNVYQLSPIPHHLGLEVHELFMSKRVAMFASGIWESPALRQIKDFDWDVVMFPKDTVTGRRAFETGGSGYCIMSTTKHPKESWEVIKCLAGEDAQIMMADAGLAQPAMKHIAQGRFWADSPEKPRNKGMLNEAVDYVVFDPFHPNWKEALSKYVYPELEMVFGKYKTEEQALKTIVREVNNLLQKGD